MKQLIGNVVSKKMAKTVKVSVLRIKVHPLYKKRIKIRKSYQVHDEIGVEIGQKVKFQACKPISKTKKWQIVKIIEVKDSEKAQKKVKKS